MKSRRKKRILSNKKMKTDYKPSKEYTINELIELGKQRNTLELAPPLFDK